MQLSLRFLVTVLTLLLLTGAASAQDTTRFPIAGLNLEVPVAPGFCAANEADVRNTGLARIMGHEMVARTRMLALHLDCTSLTRFRAGETPDTLQARYWSLVATAPDSLIFDAGHQATYDAMLQGLSNPTARRLFGKNMVDGASKTSFKPSSIVVEIRDRAIGGSVLAEVNALERWHDLNLGLALLPIRSRLILATAVETANASETGADFTEAFEMLTLIRPTE